MCQTSQSLRLTDAELVLLDRTIHKLAGCEPELQRALFEALCKNNAEDAQ